MKLGAVCGIGWVVEPHEKGKETKGGSIARTTWQEPSRLNEANSLSLSPLSLTLLLSSSSPSIPLTPRSPFLSFPSCRPFYPVILSLVEKSLLSYPLAPSRTLAVSSSLGAAPHRPKSILERRREARGRCLCKGERCDTDYGPAELSSDLLCMYREGSLFLHCRRSRLLVSSSSPLPALPRS